MELQTNTRYSERKRKIKKKYNKNPFKYICAIVLLGFAIWGGGVVFNCYTSPQLVGKWVSKETGKIVNFTKTGIVKVDNKKEGKYKIYSSNQMDYEINNYLFKMNYEINGRVLSWGIDGEELEQFERK